MNATGLLALLANGNARRQFREQFPNEYKQLCERSLNQNDVESGFGQVAGQARVTLRPSPTPKRARAPSCDLDLTRADWL